KGFLRRVVTSAAIAATHAPPANYRPVAKPHLPPRHRRLRYPAHPGLVAHRVLLLVANAAVPLLSAAMHALRLRVQTVSLALAAVLDREASACGHWSSPKRTADPASTLHLCARRLRRNISARSRCQ